MNAHALTGIIFLGFVLGGVGFDHFLAQEVGYSKGELMELKRECEKDIKHTESCVVSFVPQKTQ